jgi:chromosomal replication initiation ATPase DnaA
VNAESYRPAQQLPLALPHGEARGVDDFLVAPANRLAVDWVDRWPDWPFFTLAIVGPPGCGKSHLAGVWRARANAARIDPGAADVEQAARVAQGGAALIDDADRVAGDPAAETALLQLYNLLHAAGGKMLITAVAPPAAWPFALPDLASRLRTATVAAIGPPDDLLLRAIALKLFADRQLSVSEEVLSALLTYGERSGAGVARAVAALDRSALIAKRPITAALARQVLATIETRED